MKIYLDSCDVDIIKKYTILGIIDGVTTNPSILAKEKEKSNAILKNICDITQSSVSVEVMSEKAEDMINEAYQLLDISPYITIKLPITEDGLYACRKLSSESISVNMTLCFSASQALFAAKAGATYVSPFIGRLDDMGCNGLNLIEDICAIYSNYPNITTQILAASIRNIMHVNHVLKMGVDVITVPAKLIPLMITNPLTEQGINIFKKDWYK